jgi:flagellar assembly protein FliH
MSCNGKGRRASAHERIERFDWHDDGGVFHPDFQEALREVAAEHADAPAPASPSVDFAALERDAFAKGFAQGERSGAEASATRSEAMLRRLTHTLEDLVRLRSEMIRKTERQVVQLAMAVATRIVSREIHVDRELLVAMARVALDRLGDSASARIRLHPEDYAAVQRLGSASVRDGAVQIVSDPSIHRGGCVVESDFGLIDVSVDAQVEELTRALLSDDDSFDPVPVHALTGNAAHGLDQ